MQKEEVLGTKLWLEERENKLQGSPDPTLPHQHKFTLNKTQTNTITAFLKKNKRSWDDVIHAAWGLLLSRISTTESVTFGIAMANSKKKLSTLASPIKPIHSKITETMTVRHYLDSLERQTISKKNQDISDIRYLCITEAQISSKAAVKLDIELFTLSLVKNAKEHGKFILIYHPGFFQKDNIKKLSQYFTIIIDGLCRDLKNKIIDINVMATAEKNHILQKWAKPDYSFSTPHLSKCTHELVADFARDHSEKLAVSHNGESISFAELNSQAEKLAKVLIENGIKPQQNIAVLMERTPALIIAMLAIFKAAAIFVPINPKYPNERIEFVIEDSQAVCILTNNANKLPDKFKSKILIIPKDWRAIPSPVMQAELPATKLSDIAYIIYTSGTTGKPKGVMIRHDSLVNLTAWYQSCFQITLKDRASQFASQGFDTYLCETMTILASGASVHIVDDNIKLTPCLFFDWLKKEKISICDLPTAYAQLLFSMRWPEVLSLRMIKIGGETCTRYPAEKYSFDIWNCYGPTEATVEATYYRIYRANDSPLELLKAKTPPIGTIIANGEVYVLDKFLHPVPVGVAGELLIGGECVSSGYYNRDDLTQTKFIDNIFSPTSNKKLYKTGDLVAWLPDGNLSFIGRIDNQVKIRGYRIELGDIENVISKYPDVREVAVIAKESPSGDKSIIAYVAPNLDKERYLFQERCLLSVDDNHFMEAITEDISKYGIAISGLTEEIQIGRKVKLHLKLPGFNTSKDISARIIWQIDHRCGLIFDLNDEEKETVSKCIDYFLASHNIMDLLLSASAKRSIRKALKKKLPEYMVPSTFVTLIEFPLTFSGKIDMKALPSPNDYEAILRKQFVVPRSETEKKIAAIWNALLSRDNIGMDDNFFDLGGNSLKAAELSVKIMDEFNISIPANILFDLPYIPIISEYIDTKGEHYSTRTLIQEEIMRDSVLNENIMPAGMVSSKLDNPENILLTGAGGFLGIYMLNELLMSTSAKIYCLVRKGEFESAAKRLSDTIKKFNLQETVSLSNRRIIVVASDLCLNQFGIPLEQYKNMAEKIDTIYHCGAQVNIMASYHKLRGSNVQGTQEVIKFATCHHDKPIHYISTLSAAYLKDELGALVEEFPSEQYDHLFGGYAISKWVSERLLTELKDRGFPVTIYRSGYISGDSSTGITSLNDALLMLIKGCIDLGYAPDMQEKITILPVDFVSKAIIKLSLASHGDSSMLHIDHPTGIMWSDLVSWLNDYGYVMKNVSLEEWKKMLRNISQDNALYPFLPLYLAMPNDYHSPEVRTEKASAGLNLAGLTYPVINDNLLNIYFDYLCLEGFLTPPVRKKSMV